MMHDKRRWVVNPVPGAEELARKLTKSSWTLCSGFYVEAHAQYLFLNDATHEDGAAEFGVIRVLGPTRWIQVESITFSWATPAEALRYIQEALAGAYDANDFARPVDLAGRLDRPGNHTRCHLCA
jgi:hypothetical protein